MGLVLIVLEGSVELKLNRSKLVLLSKSFIGALIPIVGLSLMFAYALNYYFDNSIKDSLINCIPLFIISSAIAIPSTRHLSLSNRDFLIYESSFSDILGVLFFNFIALNENLNLASYGNFGLNLLITIVLSLIASVVLLILLKKINHHVKFVPIILLIILIYAIAKMFHLPALVFILLFGLSLNNLDKFWRIKWISKFQSDHLEAEIRKFKELTAEGAFLIRALFFILFGYLLETEDIINIDTLPWSVVVVVAIFFLRLLQLKLSRLPLMPLLFVAPRGLITILLFITIAPINRIEMVDNSLIIQVILLSALIMTFGLIASKKEEVENEEIVEVKNELESH